MRPLTPEDLLPLEEYAARRAEIFREHTRYVDRCRRVRLGPSLTLIFENRRTLWFRLQELLRVTRMDDPVWVERELAWYNRLLPTANRLQAALLIAIPEGPAAKEALTFWRDLSGEHLQLRIDSLTVPGRIVTNRQQDRAVGSAHWVEFQLGFGVIEPFRDLGACVWIEVEYQGYRHTGGCLTDEVLQGLLADLDLRRPDSPGTDARGDATRSLIR